MGFWAWIGERFFIISLFIIGIIILAFVGTFEAGGAFIKTIVRVILLTIAFLFMIYAGYRGRKAGWF